MNYIHWILCHVVVFCCSFRFCHLPLNQSLRYTARMLRGFLNHFFLICLATDVVCESHFRFMWVHFFIEMIFFIVQSCFFGLWIWMTSNGIGLRILCNQKIHSELGNKQVYHRCPARHCEQKTITLDQFLVFVTLLFPRYLSSQVISTCFVSVSFLRC